MKKLLLPLGILFLVIGCAGVYGILQFAVNPVTQPDAWAGAMADITQTIQQNASGRLDSYLSTMLCLKCLGTCPIWLFVVVAVLLIAKYGRRR